MVIKEIVAEIMAKQPNITNLFFVGCGASKADMYPAKYFVDGNAKSLRCCLYTANEFNYATPVAVNEQAIVVTCSLGGTTPETVKATALAKSLGAHTIALTHVAESPITADPDYTVLFSWEESYSAKLDRMIKALTIAVEVLNSVEGYSAYEKMQSALEKIYGAIDQSVTSVIPDAKAFAEAYKDTPILYLMSSGASHEVAYFYSICLMMEMQWINSASFHDGEFFHGPFEIVEKDVPFLLLMNDGRTRAMDSRALEFLNKYGAKTTLIDAKDFGLDAYADKEVIDYMNPMILCAVLRVYAEQLAIVRNHPLTKRRYMWKVSY